MKKINKKIVIIIIGLIVATFVIGSNIAKNNSLGQKNQLIPSSSEHENNSLNQGSFFPSNSHLPSHLIISSPPTNSPLLKPILEEKNSKSEVKVKLSSYNSFDTIGNKKGYFVFTNFAMLPYDDGQYFREKNLSIFRRMSRKNLVK